MGAGAWEGAEVYVVGEQAVFETGGWVIEVMSWKLLRLASTLGPPSVVLSSSYSLLASKTHEDRGAVSPLNSKPKQ